jgi:DNA-binding response OmpR family regulator
MQSTGPSNARNDQGAEGRVIPEDKESLSPERDPTLVLVVDDDADVRSVLRVAFEAEGLAVIEAADRATLFRGVETQPVGIITLDLQLGDDEGLDLAREIRAIRNVPIIMISARGRPFDRVTGLEQGADDYIVKPFHIREVLIRLRSVLKRYRLEAESAADSGHEAGQGRRYAFDSLILDSRKRRLTDLSGKPVDLTETEFELLKTFLAFAGRVLSRDELLRALRGHDWSPLDRTIDGHVARLRRKIEPVAEEPKLIKSVRGVGYVFTGDVSSV